MSHDHRDTVPVAQHGVVASISRQLAITEKLLTKLPRPECVVQPAKAIYTFAISPDGSKFLTGGYYNLHLWDVKEGNLSRVLEGHSGWLNTVSFSPDGCKAISGGSDKTIRLWDISTGACRCFRAENKVHAAAISPDGQDVYCNNFCILSLVTGDSLRKFGYPTEFIEALAISPDGQHILSGGHEKDVNLWDVNSGACIWNFKGHTSPLCAVAFSPDGHLGLSGGSDNTLRLWDLRSGECLQVFEGHSGWVKSVMFSPDGLNVLSGSRDKSLRLWNVKTGECNNIFEGHADDVEGASFINGSCHVVSVSKDGTIRIWDVETAAEIVSCNGFDNGTWTVVAPDGRYDASNNGDCPHLHWRVESTTYPVTQFKYRFYTPGLLPKLLRKKY